MSFLISYQLFLTESAKTFGEHLPSLRGLKDEAIQRKMAVEKELSEKIDLSQVRIDLLVVFILFYGISNSALDSPKRV